MGLYHAGLGKLGAAAVGVPGAVVLAFTLAPVNVGLPKLGELKPELAVEVVDGDKNAVPTEDYTLEKTERKVTSGGKVTYNGSRPGSPR